MYNLIVKTVNEAPMNKIEKYLKKRHENDSNWNWNTEKEVVKKTLFSMVYGEYLRSIYACCAFFYPEQEWMCLKYKNELENILQFTSLRVCDNLVFSIKYLDWYNVDKFLTCEIEDKLELYRDRDRNNSAKNKLKINNRRMNAKQNSYMRKTGRR